jgi:cytochrome b561
MESAMQSSEGTSALTRANPARPHAAEASGFRYAPPALWLHWLMALLIVFMIGLGLYMVAIEKQPRAEWYFELHMSIGLTLAALLLLRVAWRLRHPPADLPAGVPHWQAAASTLVHRLLYAEMLVMPLAGFTGALFSKPGVTAFGQNLRWVAPNHALSEALLTLHSVVAWLLVATIALHIAAGLKHALVDRDGVFQRMWPAG